MGRRDNQPWKVLHFILLWFAVQCDRSEGYEITPDLEEYTRQSSVIIHPEEMARRNGWKVESKNNYNSKLFDITKHHREHDDSQRGIFEGYNNKQRKNYRYSYTPINPLKTYLKFYNYYPSLVYVNKYKPRKGDIHYSRGLKYNFYPGDERNFEKKEKTKEKYPIKYWRKEINNHWYKERHSQDKKIITSTEKNDEDGNNFVEISMELSPEYSKTKKKERGKSEENKKKEIPEVISFKDEFAENYNDERKFSNNKEYRPKIIYYNYVNKDRLFYGGSRKNHHEEERENSKKKHNAGWHWHDADEGHVGWFWHSPSYEDHHKKDYKNVWQSHNTYRD